MGVTEVNEDNLVHESESIHHGVQSRQDKLVALGKAFGQLLSSGNLTGQTAKNIDAYISEVHQNGILKALNTLVQAYDDATVMYVGGYTQVDSSPTAHLLKDELDDHKQQLNSFSKQFSQAQKHIARIVNSVSTIYVPGSYQDFLGKMRKTEDKVEDMKGIVRDLLSDWKAYEATNYYQNVAALLPKVEAALSQFKGKNLASVSSYASGSFASLNQEMMGYVDQMGQIHSQYSKDFSNAWKGVQKTEKAIDDAKAKQKADAEKNFWTTVGLTALAVVVTVATGGLASPLAVTLFAVDMAFSANTLVASASEAITGHEFNPMVEGLKLTGMDDKTAATVVNVASMSTIVVGGFAGGSKMLGKAATLYKAGELSSTVVNGIRQIPKLPATAVRSVLDTASDVKTFAVNKMGSVLDKVSTKAGAAASKLDDIHVPGVRVLDTGVGVKMPTLTKVAASDTRLGGAVKQTFSNLENKAAGASEKMGGLTSKGSVNMDFSGGRPSFKIGESDGGPGSWENRATPEKGAGYQEKVTGAPKDTEYVVKTNQMSSGEKKFDGYNPETNTLIDAKDYKTGSDGFPPTGKGKFTVMMENKVIKEAEHDAQIANEAGSKLEWHVPTQEKANQLQKLFDKNKINIHVVVNPK